MHTQIKTFTFHILLNAIFSKYLSLISSNSTRCKNARANPRSLKHAFALDILWKSFTIILQLSVTNSSVLVVTDMCNAWYYITVDSVCNVHFNFVSTSTKHSISLVCPLLVFYQYYYALIMCRFPWNDSL